MKLSIVNKNILLNQPEKKIKTKRPPKNKLPCEINMGKCSGCCHVSKQGVCCANDPDNCPRK